jgi:hypothetical protein
MISTTDPESMTAEDRRLEVASILARGLLRRVRMVRTAKSPHGKTVSKRPRNSLEVSADRTEYITLGEAAKLAPGRPATTAWTSSTPCS